MPVVRLVLIAAALATLVAGSAQAAPVGGLKQYKVPTASSQPRAITNGSDGNRWFTLGTEFTNAPPAIARITPGGVGIAGWNAPAVVIRPSSGLFDV